MAADLPGDSPLLREELFGPLVTVEAVPSIDAALAVVDSLPFALTGGLFSRSPRTIDEVVRRMPVGNLYVNRAITGAMVARQPFGGNRRSGTGTQAGGPDYLRQFTEPGSWPRTRCATGWSPNPRPPERRSGLGAGLRAAPRRVARRARR